MNEQINTIKNWLGTGSINIFGRPFAGKDTQGEKLAEMFGGPLLGGGEIMRSYHDQEALDKIMATGNLVPHELYLKIVLPYLSREEFAQSPLILSALGRSHGEGPVILKATEEAKHPIKAVVLLELSEDEVWKRFRASQAHHDRDERADDNEVVLKNRLNKFNERTLPVIDFYRSNNLIIEVDGMLEPNEVTKEIINALAARASTPS